MNIKKQLNLIIYRFREKGLEIFLVNDESENWDFPKAEVDASKPSGLPEDTFIELDPIDQENGETENAVAAEGDWHDIPSLKNMLLEDAHFLKEKVKDMDQGTFQTLKDALQKAMPHQYAFLKELKDILVDRNSIRDL